jgi:hypothetical protein
MRRTVSAVVGLAICLGAGSAQAQDFGESMTVVFSADRLFGLHFSKRTTENPGHPDDKLSSTHIELGWAGRGDKTPFDVPRFAFDIFVIDGLSVGGAIGYASTSFEDENNNDTNANDFVFAPRVGYVWMFSDVAGFWLRGGFTYHRAEFRSEQEEYGFAFTADPTFVLSPVEHFAFVAGVNADIDMTGELDPVVGPDVDRRYRSIGIQLGLLGYL